MNYMKETCKAVHIHVIPTFNVILQINLIAKAKESCLNVTCEVSPHHLFLTSTDLPPGVRQVRVYNYK